ncbi:MAG: hypothetical protein GY696_00665, partial [Gammaproteobacteria bacterium]|nr:hypothetical protein [Gammaproteobacteria bacterium]
NPDGNGQGNDQQPEPYSRIEKNLDLFALLGAEGQRLFNGTEDSDNFDRPHADVLAICDRIFGVQVNKLVALHKFRKRERMAKRSR